MFKHTPNVSTLLLLSLTFWSLVFTVFILVIVINVDLVGIGLFGKLGQLTARGVAPTEVDAENVIYVTPLSLEHVV